MKRGSWKGVERRLARDVGSERIPVTDWKKYDRLVDAAQMYESGQRVADIAAHYGVSKKVVLRALHAAGVRFRSRLATPEKIERRIDKSGECWLWTGALDWKGYGVACFGGTHVRVHRWMYERSRGPIAEGHQLDHLCRTPRCVRPDHLEPVSAAANTQRGTMAKMTPEKVREMRELYQSGESQGRLAARFGLHVETVRGIVNRKSWANV